jgi:hypothetical protein
VPSRRWATAAPSRATRASWAGRAAGPAPPSSAAPGAGDQRHQPPVPTDTDGSPYRPWRGCHDGAIEPSTAVRLGRQEGTPMDPGNPVVLVVATVAGLFVLLLGRSWPCNGHWPWQRPPPGSDGIDPGAPPASRVARAVVPRRRRRGRRRRRRLTAHHSPTGPDGRCSMPGSAGTPGHGSRPIRPACLAIPRNLSAGPRSSASSAASPGSRCEESSRQSAASEIPTPRPSRWCGSATSALPRWHRPSPTSPRELHGCWAGRSGRNAAAGCEHRRSRRPCHPVPEAAGTSGIQRSITVTRRWPLAGCTP